MNFQNVPNDVQKLENLIDIIDRQIISAAIFNSENINISLFGFSDLENISEEQYAGDTLFYIITGSCTIKMPNENIDLTKGDIYKVNKNILHSIHADKGFKMMQITLKK